MNKTIKITLFITGVLALAAGGYWLWNKQRKKSGNPIKDGRKITWSLNSTKLSKNG